MVDRYSDKELEELAVSLRDETKRRTLPKTEIQYVFHHLTQNQPIQNTVQLNTSILSLKILSNFVADVPENASFVIKLIKDTIPMVPFDLIQFPSGSANINEVELFTNVQLILINNLLTTSKESFSMEICNLMLDKIFSLFTLCESASIDINNALVVEILDEFEPIVGKIPALKFLILRDLCRCINDNARADGDEDLTLSSSKVCLKYSCNIDVPRLSTTEKEHLFFELYDDLNSTDDEQILLNISYELKIGTEAFFERLLSTVFDSNGVLKIRNHIPMSLIVLANEITSEKTMMKFVERVSVERLTDTYFSQIYPELTLQLPWELQSIVLFNKLPIGQLAISNVSLACYINKLSSLIRYTTLQIRLEVVSLQLVFLGKILAQTENVEQRKSIVDFLNNLKLSNEYDSFPTEFKQTLNQVSFPFLSFRKGSPSDVGDILSVTLREAGEILERSMAGKIGVQIKYLIELSQILGFYVQLYGSEEWFQRCFNILETSVEGSKRQLKMQMDKEPSKYEQVAWRVLEDNIKYTDALLKQG